ncbi:MAG: hypothetical protein OCD76_02535 [Reichenbachiella sp.]
MESKRDSANQRFEFSCSWNSKHGIGIMTLKDRIIETGEADVSFLNWIAEEDL